MNSQMLGHIDQLDGRDIVGWLYSPAETVVPQLYVNGRPCTLLDWPTSRPDVAEALGTSANVGVNVGFRFAVPALPAGAEVCLHMEHKIHNSPRPHVHRAHWRGFWSDSRKPSKSSGENVRKLTVKWLRPIPVALGKDGKDENGSVPGRVPYSEYFGKQCLMAAGQHRERNQRHSGFRMGHCP